MVNRYIPVKVTKNPTRNSLGVFIMFPQCIYRTVHTQEVEFRVLEVTPHGLLKSPRTVRATRDYCKPLFSFDDR